MIDDTLTAYLSRLNVIRTARTAALADLAAAQQREFDAALADHMVRIAEIRARYTPELRVLSEPFDRAIAEAWEAFEAGRRVAQPEATTCDS